MMVDSCQAPQGFLAAIDDAVGPEHCLSDPDLKASYELDWTRRFGGSALVVVRPANTSEVASVLAACSRFQVGVVPQGGNTGLVGGSVPRDGEAVLSLSRLNRVLGCDPEEGLLVAEAGTTLATAQAAAAGVHAGLGIDIAARDSATLGGMVATNAGGIHVIRYGPMRARLGGIEVVLADGTVASRLSGLVKDNVGYDLAQIMTGSEGTLGVVTKVVLHLVPLPRFRVTALIGLRGIAHSAADPATGVRAVSQVAVALAARLRRRVDGIDALELVYANGMALVREVMGLPAPPDPGADAWLLVEASGGQDPSGMLAEAIEDAAGVTEIAVADDAGGRAHLWAYRERHTEAIATLGVAHKLDLTLPMNALAEFAGAVRSEVSAALGGATDTQVILFGHVGDGNIHVNLIGPEPGDYRADNAVFRMVIERGGSISAEHGVGIAKLDFVTAARSVGDLTVMRRMKGALDPGGILNPGVLLPPIG
ncbi:MAG: FAD-binding oxidoreductase [Acidimicrobiales bacterium]|jgi:FAD/FMN-containing dehydrogenase